MSNIENLIEFPVIYTFKIVGENISGFLEDIVNIFAEYDDMSVKTSESSGGKYLSASVTVEVKDYGELEELYRRISNLKYLKFYA